MFSYRFEVDPEGNIKTFTLNYSTSIEKEPCLCWLGNPPSGFLVEASDAGGGPIVGARVTLTRDFYLDHEGNYSGSKPLPLDRPVDYEKTLENLFGMIKLGVTRPYQVEILQRLDYLEFK